MPFGCNVLLLLGWRFPTSGLIQMPLVLGNLTTSSSEVTSLLWLLQHLGQHFPLCWMYFTLFSRVKTEGFPKARNYLLFLHKSKPTIFADYYIYINIKDWLIIIQFLTITNSKNKNPKYGCPTRESIVIPSAS